MKRLNKMMFDARRRMAENIETLFKLAMICIIAFFATQLAFADCAGHFGDGILVSVGAFIRGLVALGFTGVLTWLATILCWTEIAEGFNDWRSA